MAHDYKKPDDNEIVKLVDDNVRTSTGYTSSDLAKEREKVLQYYNAKLPKPAHDGNSKYVSQTVFNAVQSMSVALLKHSQQVTVSLSSRRKALMTLRKLQSVRPTLTMRSTGRTTVSTSSPR